MTDTEFAAAQKALDDAKAASAEASKTFTDFNADFTARRMQHDVLEKQDLAARQVYSQKYQVVDIETRRRAALPKA